MDKEKLIQSLIKWGILKDKKIIEAFQKVPRENFVSSEHKKWAYADSPLPIGSNQTISAPHMVATMSEAIGVEDGQKILEIGAGSGYQAAILSVLNSNGKIYTVENVEELYEFAKENLKEYKNVEVISGDGSLGYEKEAPYDRILATCGCPKIPDPWISQLKKNGKILAPVGSRYIQNLVLIEKVNDKILRRALDFPCAFVPLTGKYGW